MDAPGRNAAILLEVLQDAMTRLGQIWSHFVKLGTQPGRPFLVLGSRPFTIQRGQFVRKFNGCVSVGLPVRGADGKDYELSVDVLWDETAWTIMTEAWVGADDGQVLLRELPERSAADLAPCLKEIREAVESVVDFQDLIPGKT